MATPKATKEPSRPPPLEKRTRKPAAAPIDQRNENGTATAAPVIARTESRLQSAACDWLPQSAFCHPAGNANRKATGPISAMRERGPSGGRRD